MQTDEIVESLDESTDVAGDNENKTESSSSACKAAFRFSCVMPVGEFAVRFLLGAYRATPMGGGGGIESQECGMGQVP